MQDSDLGKWLCQRGVLGDHPPCPSGTAGSTGLWAAPTRGTSDRCDCRRASVTEWRAISTRMGATVLPSAKVSCSAKRARRVS